MASECRSKNLDVGQYDAMDKEFFQDIARGRLAVRTVSRRDVMRARQLIRFAGVVKGRSLTTMDALIATTCLELALEIRQVVRFYTSDRKLYSTLRELDAFRATMDMFFIGPPKSGVPSISRAKRPADS